jgi:hypothetical protein
LRWADHGDGRTQYVIGPIASSYDADVTATGVTQQYKVGERFLETRKVAYDWESLRDWVRQNSKAARGYAVPVLFPIDFLFMIIVGAALAAASIMFASSLGLGRIWLWACLFPALYVTFDLAEDALLVRMLTSADTITSRMVDVVKVLTWIKIRTLQLAAIQSVLLFAWAAGSGWLA